MNKKIFDYSYTLKKQKQHKDIMILVYIISAVLIISLTFGLFIFPVKQQSSSMTPNIKKQSYLMVTPMVKTPSRGDVILLDSAYSGEYNFFKKIGASIVKFFTAQKISILEDKSFPGTSKQIRRVIGVPGDTLYIEDFIAHVRPKGDKYFLTEFELNDKSYDLQIENISKEWDDSFGFSDKYPEITLGEDEYFVLSDDRNIYSDSRLWGVIKQDSIKGKVLFTFFPFTNLKLF